MNSSDCRKSVAERWGKLNYRTLGNDISNLEESEDSTDIEERENKRPRHEVIDLTTSDDDDDDDDENDVDQPAVIPFRLMRSSMYDTGISSPHFITLEEILGDETLKTCVLFSYQFAMDFLLEHFHSDIESITIVGQKGTITPITTERALEAANKLTIVEVLMPPYTCHHSKMIICFYKNDTCKIFMPSSNFSYAETNLPQQVCWCSPTLYSSKCKYVRKKSIFQDNLIDYLSSYGKNALSKNLIPMIEKLGFEPLGNTQFIYSTPTKNCVSGLRLLGAALLGNVEKDEKSSVKHYFCQTSTIGSAISKKTHGNLFTHAFIPFLERIITSSSKPFGTDLLLQEYKNRHIKPYILYPTVQEIQNSPAGWSSSGWFHFNRLKDDQHYKILLNDVKAFYKQDPHALSWERKATPCHSKFYMKSTTDIRRVSKNSQFHSLDWCVYTSSNLSLSAWGNLNGNPRNYEAGILLTSKENALHCRSFIDVIYNKYQLKNKGESFSPGSTVVMVPFPLSPTSYNTEEGDEAFCMSKNYDLVDTNGRRYEA